MKAELIIEQSIKTAKSMGVVIVRGPIFIWGSGDVPKGCDCSGAVLLVKNKAIREFPNGWLKELCIDILGKDTYWWWKFSYGFNQGRPIDLYTEDGKGKRIYFQDEVSKSGFKLAKKVGLYLKK